MSVYSFSTTTRLKGRPVHGRWLALLVGALLVGFTVYLSFSSEPRLLHVANGDKYGHFLAYFVLMIWFGLIFPSLASYLVSAVALSGMGIAIELLQRLTVTRAFELLDAVASVSGVLIALMVLLAGSHMAGLLIRGRDLQRERRGTS